MAAAARAYDLIVWGGSGFTGRLAAEYLARKYTAAGGTSSSGGGDAVRWAIAGRDKAKLESIRDVIMEKHPHVKDIDILVGSNDDPASLEAVASKANTVLSFAGPFAKFGMPLAGEVREEGKGEASVSPSVNTSSTDSARAPVSRASIPSSHFSSALFSFFFLFFSHLYTPR